MMRWRYAGMVIMVAMVLWREAAASNYVCGDMTKLGYYAQAIDPSKIPPCLPPFTVDPAGVPEAEIPAQDTLYRTVPPRHLKVVDGLMVEMTQAEKDAVDAPLILHQQAVAVAQAEIQGNEVCANNTLQEITAYWKGPGGKQEQLTATIATLDAAIAAVTAGPAKTAILAAREAIVAHMTMFINDSELQWRYICSRTFVKP